MEQINFKATLRTSIITLIAVLLALVSTASTYWVEKNLVDWPWANIGLVTAIVLGIFAISIYPFRNTQTRVIATILYLICFLIAIFFTGLLTACSFGECI